MDKPPPNLSANLTSHLNREHFFRTTGSAAIPISPSHHRTTNPISDVACFRNRPVPEGLPPLARPTRVIFLADTLSFSRWAVLRRVTSFCSLNPGSALEEISRSSPTPRP